MTAKPLVNDRATRDRISGEMSIFNALNNDIYLIQYTAPLPLAFFDLFDLC